MKRAENVVYKKLYFMKNITLKLYRYTYVYICSPTGEKATMVGMVKMAQYPGK